MLSAGITQEELITIAEWSSMLPSQIARVEKFGVNEGHLVFHRPCIFLLGKPLNHVNCRAYRSKRPKVCEIYLCKIAIQYKMGIVSLHEGLFLLREAFNRSDPTLFNWTGSDDGESFLMLRSAADQARKKLREEMYPDPVIDVIIADVILPRYEFVSSIQETTFRAILKSAQEDRIDPLLFFDVEELVEFTPEQIDAVIATQRQIFHRLREMFKEQKSGEQEESGEKDGK